MRRRRLLLWRILMPLSAVFLTLLLADLFLVHRLAGAPDRATFLMGFYARPGALIDGVSINSMGFTGHAPGPEKVPGGIRVLTLGGSVLFNRQITAKLASSLSRKLGRPVEVLGAALRVHNTWASRLKMELLARRRFDYVIICHGINDLDANRVAPGDFREDYSQLSPWYHRGFFVDHSAIARLIYNFFIYQKPPKRQPEACLSAGVYARNLKALVKMARASGARPLLLTFGWVIPEKYSLEGFRAGLAGYVNPENYDPCPVEMWGSPAYVGSCLEENNRLLRELAAQERVPLVDEEALLGKDPGLFGDLCHPNARGVELLVSGITEKIAEIQGMQSN